LTRDHRFFPREAALLNFYQAERRAGADALTAHERMAEFAKRLDALSANPLYCLNRGECESDLQIIQKCLERT
jgi:hypothetical protein